MASQRKASPASTSSSATPPPLTAVVKGAGPSGLASAIALAQNGFAVRVVEKRVERSIGQGRQNMVAIRPEGLRRLEQLGALSSLFASRNENGNNTNVTRMTEAQTSSEIDGSVFPWSLTYYPPAEPTKFREGEEAPYEVPATLAEQFPSTFVTLGGMEDSLRQSATKLGVEITCNATLALKRNEGAHDYAVTLVESSGRHTELGTPTLIVLASGKNDPLIADQLSFTRRIGVLLESSNLPDLNSSTNPRALQLSDTADHEIESQLFCVFGVENPSASSVVGTLDHIVRKYTAEPTAKTFQPVIEIQMNHVQSAHLILHLPRSLAQLQPYSPELETYIISRINEHLKPETPWTSVQQLKDQGIITWGDPLQPVTVETSTSPQYAYGSNVVLVGDAAISCSPSSGIGADIGLTVDSKSIATLAESLAKIEKELQTESKRELTMKALDEFNLRKAESAVLWSQGSRMFYLTQEQANKILGSLKKEVLSGEEKEKLATLVP